MTITRRRCLSEERIEPIARDICQLMYETDLLFIIVCMTDCGAAWFSRVANPRKHQQGDRREEEQLFSGYGVDAGAVGSAGKVASKQRTVVQDDC